MGPPSQWTTIDAHLKKRVIRTLVTRLISAPRSISWSSDQTIRGFDARMPNKAGATAGRMSSHHACKFALDLRCVSERPSQARFELARYQLVGEGRGLVSILG